MSNLEHDPAGNPATLTGENKKPGEEMSTEDLNEVTGGSSPAGHVSVQDIHVTKNVDKSSSNLF